jgi:hypothetical protein
MSIENVYLQSFQNYDKILNLSNHNILNKIETTGPTSGWYTHINEALCYLLFDKIQIFFSFGERVYKIDESIVAKLLKSESENVFELYKKEDLLISFTYPKTPEYLEGNIFGFVEDEDFDWGLFLVNIINSRARQEIIFEEINNSKIKGGKSD